MLTWGGINTAEGLGVGSEVRPAGFASSLPSIAGGKRGGLSILSHSLCQASADILYTAPERNVLGFAGWSAPASHLRLKWSVADRGGWIP